MKQKAYEILFITAKNVSEEQRTKTADEIQNYITKLGGSILELVDLGLKDFAMEMKKQKQGYYYQCHFLADNEQLNHLQTELKVNENIFRYLIVTLDSVLTKDELANKVTVA